MGYPLIVVIGAKALQAEPKLELHMHETKLELRLPEILGEILKYKQHKEDLLSKSLYLFFYIYI